MLIEWHCETPRPDAASNARHLGRITHQRVTGTHYVDYYTTDDSPEDIDAFNTEKRRVLAANIGALHFISKRGY